MSGRENKTVFALWLALAVGAAGAGFFLFEIRRQPVSENSTTVLPPPRPVGARSRIDRTPAPRLIAEPAPDRLTLAASVAPEPAPDPATATRAIEAMPESPSRTAQLLQALREWSGRDPIRAGAWVATMPDEPARAAAIMVHAEVLRVEGPRTAALWLSTLPAADQPWALLEEIGGDWLRINREDAEAWLAQTPLSEARREHVRAAFELNAESP